VDEQQREIIRDDLRGLLRGELLFDELSRALYSTDASVFQVSPLAVVVPRDEEDVQALVRYAAEHQVDLVPRGAGTGLAGEALGTGIVVDLSKHFRSVLDIGPDSVRVQPGVALRELNALLERLGRRFAPDPGITQCTLGGMLATNASGVRSFRHGYTRDHVVGLRATFNDGSVSDVGLEPRPTGSEPGGGRKHEIVSQVCTLLDTHRALIQSCRPRTPFNRCGYLLNNVLSQDHLDLARLLVGSEGTLALFTEATLRTIQVPGGRSLVLLGFESLDAAVRASQRVIRTEPTACELLDRRIVTLARGGGAEVAATIPSDAEAVLLIEYEADSPREARRLAWEATEQFFGKSRLALCAATAFESREIDDLWRLRESALPSLYGLRGGRQPVAFIEDVAVPVEELSGFLHRVQDILQRQETTASFLVHAATGQVHTRPFLDLQRPEDVAKMWAIAEEVHALALDLGGTVSSQHGTGLARTPWVGRQYGQLYPVFRELKAIFDPQSLFNPGKIIGPAPGLPAWPLRGAVRKPEAGDAEKPEAAPALRWEPREIAIEILQCNGCGHCRTEAPGQRMCPIFRATQAEAASPRAKANLLRYLMQPGSDPRLQSSDDVREVADLCVNCKMCARECPAHVNIPKLMLEAKAANVGEHGMHRTDWVLARTESFAALGSVLSVFVNAGLRSRTVRWLLEKLFGVSRQRRLPAFAFRSFLRRAARRGWTRPPRGRRPRVAYFVDVFANYNDPQVAEAVVAVLHHNGIEVYVPPGQRGCGMAPLAYGDVEGARETAEHNLRILAELAREGYRILCSEPTAALLLRHDCLDLLEDPDARLVADQVVEFTSFLWELHEQGRLRTDFRPVPLSVGHHVPCHLKALGATPAGPRLLALIPQMRVHTIDVSCSGMAGTFGLKADSYALSLEAGRPLLKELRRPRVLTGSTECGPCRMQMEEGSGKRTLHPAQYLALAYGCLPEVAERLREPIPDLVLK
jgi:FAD/FMN-containing dehydrogenase/Fe-S oxidoreductase